MSISEILSLTSDEGINSGWICCETRHLAIELDHALSADGQTAWRVMPLRDGFSTLLQLLGDKGRALGEIPEYLVAPLLSSLVLKSKESYPTLAQEISAEGSGSGSVEAAGSIKNFIDALRLNDSADGVLRNAVDEYGEVQSEGQRIAELLQLLTEYQELQFSLSAFDAVGRLEELLTLLSRIDSSSSEAAALPDPLVLYRPSHFYPLERLLLHRVSQLTRVRIYLDKQLVSLDNKSLGRPSLRFPQSVRTFLEGAEAKQVEIRSIEDSSPAGRIFCEAAIDSSSSAAIEAKAAAAEAHISLWEAGSRREEVERAGEWVDACLNEEEAAPSDLQIVAPCLESYAEFIQHTFERRGINYRIPKGTALSRSGAGALFQSFLDFVLNPSLGTAEGYYNSPLVVPLNASEHAVEGFRQSYKSQLDQVFNAPDWYDAERQSRDERAIVSSGVDLSLLRREAERIGLGIELSEFSQLAGELLGYYAHLFSLPNPRFPNVHRLSSRRERREAAERFLTLVDTLAALNDELNMRSALVGPMPSVEQAASALWAAFWQRRCSLSLLRRSQSHAFEPLTLEFLGEVRSMRELQRMVRSAIKDLGRVRLWDDSNGEGVEVWKSALQLLQMRLKSGSLRTEVDPDAVSITELLDLRGVSGKRILIVGLTESAFPAASGTSSLAADETTSAVEYIKKCVQESSPLYESYWLLGHVFRNAEQVVLSFPNESERGEHSPSALLVKLHELGVPYRGPIVVEPPKNGANTDVVERRAALLRAREKPEFSPFDGALEPAWLSRGEALRPQMFRGSGVFRFTVSDLEQYQECPQRFFFSRVMGLDRPEVPFADEVRRHIGTAVHKALERFFRSERVREGIVVLGDPGAELSAQSRKLMYDIASSVLNESEVAWDSHPVLRNAVHRIVEGLVDGSSKKGFLRAALEYQKDFIDTFPLLTEYRFGLSDSETAALPLSIRSGGGVVEISGIVDRIDGVREADGAAQYSAIWDYKTGKPRSLLDVDRQKSLQLPLYAAAVKQNFSEHAKLRRGGCISLAQPNAASDDAAALSKKVLVEHLALKPASRSSALEPQFIDERIAKASETVEQLSALLAAGTFTQKLETKTCEYCEFQHICARSEPALERKCRSLGGGEGEVADLAAERPRKESNSVLPAQAASMRIQLSKEQEDASAIEHSVSLIAGAGSGKTAVLRTRVLRLIASGVPVHSILAITFTEKAAREIKSRIQTGIQQALREGSFDSKPLDEHTEQYLIEADACMPEAQFSTIHSFAAKVVSADPYLAGGVGGTRVLEGGEALELLQRAVNMTLGDAANESGTGEVDYLLSKGVWFRSMQGELVRLAARPNQLSELGRTLAQIDENGDAAALERSELGKAIVEAEQREAALRRTQVELFVEEWRQSAAAWLSRAEITKKLGPERSALFQELLGKTENLLAARSEKEWHSRLSAAALWAGENNAAMLKKSKANPRNYWKELRDELERAAAKSTILDWEFEQQGVKAARALYRLAKTSSEAYRRLKAEIDAYDFDDLIRTAHRMLCGNFSGSRRTRQFKLRARLRKQYCHIMVDEFQDTDREQWEMVRELAALDRQNASADEMESPRTLFIVGDRQQSIYGFRNSDPGIFEEASRYLTSHGGAACSLTNNYRSRAGVVKAVNALFKPIFSADYNGDGEPYSDGAVSFQAMRAAASDDAAEAAVFSLIPSEHRVDSESVSHKRREAQNTAAFVQQVVDDYRSNGGTWPRLQRIKSGPAVAVLTRSVRELVSVARELELRGVEFGVSHSTGFYQLEEVRQLENLLTALSNQSNVIELVGVLRSALFGLSDSDLLEICADLEGRWRLLWLPEAAVCDSEASSIAGTLQRWSLLSRLLTPAGFLQRVVLELELEHVYCRAGRPEAFDNILRFIEALRHAEISGFIAPGLRGALAWIAEQKKDMRNAPNSNSLAHPVVLTTVHGAKGLEYPMVVLPFLQQRSAGDRDFVLGHFKTRAPKAPFWLGIKTEHSARHFERVLPAAGAAVERNAVELNTAEERRVFYVGCTRAEDYLVLSMPQTRRFKAEQEELEAMTLPQQREGVRLSRSPLRWLRLLGRVDDAENPSEWLYDAGDGELLRIPALSVR